MKHEQELLQISYDEIKLSLDTMTKDTYLYNKCILNLRMLELKIEIIKVDTEYIISRYLTDCTSQQTPDSIHDPAKSESATSS